jgi:uncharacterized membrane protein (UPF0182 family)
MRDLTGAGRHGEVEPRIPAPGALWGAVRNWIWFGYAVLILAAIPDMFVQYWFNSSLTLGSVFVTNFTTETALFVLFGGLTVAAVVVPVRLYAMSTGLRRAAMHCALWIGIFAGWRAAGRYADVLLALYGVPFGRTDPVFGHDLGFYVYWLPILREAVTGATWLLVIAIVSTVVARYDAMRQRGVLGRSDVTLWAKAALFCPPGMRRLLDVEGLIVAAFLFLLRYALLFKDNDAAGVRTGAQYVDLVGVFSTLNYLYVSIGVELALCAVIHSWMKGLHDTYGWLLERPAALANDASTFRTGRVRRLETAAVAFLAVDLLAYRAQRGDRERRGF